MTSRHGYLLVILLVIIYGVANSAAQTGNKTIDDKIKNIFGNLKKSPIEPVTMPPPVTPGDDDCECVVYYLCNGTHINTDGEGLIDIRGGGDCESYLEMCCKVADIVPKIEPDKKVPHPTGCGWRNPKGVSFHTQGDIHGEAKFGEFPWMVAILYEVEMTSKVLSHYKCGGSLIHPQAVITSAHCVNNRDYKYVARAGEWDTQTTNEILPHQNRYIKSITIHPQYYSGALYNDIALLILEKPFDLAEHIDIACLPPRGTVIPPGTTCWASGWGKDQFGADGKYQVILKNLDLPFVDHPSCQDALRETRLGRRFRLHDSFVCAGGAGKDTCLGDGGSPLVCPIPGQTDRYQQVGMVAWGIGCAETNVPGVYGSTIYLRQWIDDEMAKNNLDTSPYQY